ncbi:serine hydrolase domain-containing protein [Flagellimonas nanhaiensis]|uniref:Class C beta-lactamase-related serine hydrolase n=1 Tax=Flagellimonas nanhaiensis TaxID=2292706 RepID=A0A371JPJ1_9FLAO|nr:serine hydrolase [Allomuricauda nanhaiensis]RDY59401.1 class C beta-lactamase-related serine hydrolase [Allomuricauda nanhaiensis]
MILKLTKHSPWVKALLPIIACVFVGRSQELPKEIDSFVQGFEEKQEFNGTILVAKNGQVLFQKGYGFSNVADKTENEVATKFSIGSLTKSFMACAIMQQIEKGTLDLHAPIRNYIPELRDDLGKLTLHHLLKNSSGLPVHLNRLTTLEYRDISSKELIQLYNEKAELSMEPGSSYSYSNLNYQLAALVLEKVSGISYEQYMNDKIFKPLKMHSSGIERTHKFPSDKAKGHQVENGEIIPAQRNFMAYAKGGGDMYTTVLDLLKWDQALYTDDFISEEAKEKLFDGTPGIYGGYGYGFKIKYYKRHSDSRPEGKLVRHGGSMYGYVCNLHRYIDDEITIIILGNIRPYPIMEITEGIESILFKYHYL